MSSFITYSNGNRTVRVNAIDPPKELNISGSGVTVTDNPTLGRYDIVISGGGGGGGGTVTGAANVGTGTGNVFRDVTTGTINLKTLKAGTNISITDNANDITIADTYSPPSATTSTAGIVTLATPSSDTTAGHVVQASDTRLSDSRNPLAHKQTHVSGGSDSFVKGDVLVVSSRYHETLGVDPTSDSGRIWINNTNLKYWDNEGTPVLQTTEIQSNKGTASGYCDLDSGIHVPLSRLSGIVDANLGTFTSSKISIISKSQLNSAIVYNDQTNTFGSFAQSFPNSQLYIQNPAGTFAYIIATSAITANRTATLPLLTGNDQFTMDTFATTLTNKTVNISNNTITDTSPATGDILKGNGTKYITLARGTANQVLSVNPSGTDIVWTTLSSSGISTSSPNTWTAVQTFDDGDLALRNPANTFSTTLSAGAQTVNNTFTFPVTSGNDTITTNTATETLTNKTISGASNTITNISDSALSTNVDLLNASQTNTGNKTFNDTTLLLRNPANTFSTTISAGAQTASNTFTFPVTGSDTIATIASTQTLTNKTLTTPTIASILNTGTLTLPTSTDTLVGRATTDTLTNKTINATNNTITDTSIATGDLLKGNGTKFVRFAMGSANQMLVVNSGGTDLTWVAPPYTENKGSISKSGTASATTFTIAHGLTGGTPTWYTVNATTADADDDFYLTVDATNITVNYSFAPPSGTYNLGYEWRAAL